MEEINQICLVNMFKMISSFLLALAVSTAYVKADDDLYVLECQQEPIEFGIVLDSSSSISHKDFKKGIEFLQNFLSQYEIGPEDVRVSIITFGYGIYEKDAFNLTTYNTKEEVIDAIGNITHEAGLYTDTGLGIQYMTQHQLSPLVTRKEADKIGIVITDGNSQKRTQTKTMARIAREAGILMFAIGVGRVTGQELINIAGDEDRVFKVKNYDSLDNIKTTLARKTCIKKLRPTTTPLPQTACGVDEPGDIYFAFSPAELGSAGTSWVTSFIDSTVGNEEIKEGFRFGVVSGNCPDDEGFDLDDYKTAEGIKERVNQYKEGKMSKLVEKLTTDGYSEAKGGRVDARDIAVLVATGGKRAKAQLKKEATRLIELGVQVFIADPTNTGIQIEDAITLEGRGARVASTEFVGQLCLQRTGDA